MKPTGQRATEARNQPAHPIEKQFAERFEFLSSDERSLALACVRSGDTPLSELVRELVFHIDSECEWARIEKATPEQIKEELREAGCDSTGGFDRLCDMLARHGVKIKTAEEWRVVHAQEYRNLFGLE